MYNAFKYLLLALLILLVTGYAIWTEQRSSGFYLSDLRSEVSLNLGTPGDLGNLLGIQPELFANDYRSPQLLRLKLAAYLDKAQREGLLNHKTLVVLPEHIGTWLLVNGEKQQVYEARSVRDAQFWLASSNPLKLLRALLATTGEDRLTEALLRMKAVQMATTYQQLFGGLARDYGITLVAGSIILPQPVVKDGALLVGAGPLYNVSLVFGTDGQPIGQPQRKVTPAHDERGYIAASPASALQVLDTPAGRLGVLIGTDSWNPQAYAALANQQVELLAIPAFLAGNGSRDQPWDGDNGVTTPDDVRLKSGELSEGEAWRGLTMAERIGRSGASAGIQVFMGGRLWGMMSSDGRNLLPSSSSRAQLINLWLH